MNYHNIQNELLKSAYARDTKNKNFPYNYGIVGEYICITDGFKLEKIPKDKFFLNIETVFKNKEPINMVKIMDDSDAKEVRNTMMTKMVDDKTHVAIFQIDDSDEELWINVKLLKDFDLKNSHFKGINRRSPLFIYEDEEEVVGLVLPINHH